MNLSSLPWIISVINQCVTHILQTSEENVQADICTDVFCPRAQRRWYTPHNRDAETDKYLQNKRWCEKRRTDRVHCCFYELSTDAKCSDKNKRQSSSYEYDWIHEDDAVYQHLVTVSGKVWAPLVSSGQSAGKSSQQFRKLTNLQFSFKMRCAVLKHPNKPTDVGFPRPQTVSRHHLSGKRRSELLQETFHICFLGFYEQQARKRETVLTDTPETLWQSSPQLFHFAHFLRGLRGWHQVAHYYLFLSLPPTLAVGWLWGFKRRRRRRTGAQAALRGFFSPAATRWQTQETEPERLSLLSSTSENKCLLETDSRMRLHFHKRHKKSALEHPKWQACVIVCALAQRANGARLLTSFSSLSVPLAPSSATVYI